MPNYTKICSCLHVHFTGTRVFLYSLYRKTLLEHIISWGVSENHFWWKTLIYWKNICCMCTLEFPQCTLEFPQWGKSNVYQQYMLLIIRNSIWNLHLSRIMSIAFASFKHLKLPISIKISATIWQSVLHLHNVQLHMCITKFDFTNYPFANLLLAQL